MKKFLFLLSFTLISSGCMASRNTENLYSSQLINSAAKCSDAAPYKEVKVSWYQKLYETDVQKALAEEQSGYVTCTPENYSFLTQTAEKVYSKYGLLNKSNGKDALHVHLVSENWWTYSKLWNGFFTDTTFMFLFPASIVTTHKLKVTTSREEDYFSYSQEGEVKSTFQLFLFVLAPFSGPYAKQNAAVEDLLMSSLTPLLINKQKEECKEAAKK